MYLPRTLVRPIVGEKLVLWINPETVDLHVGTKKPNLISLKNRMKRLRDTYHLPAFLERPILNAHALVESFVIPSKNYRSPKPIVEVAKFALVKDMIENQNDIHNSIWFQKLMDDVENKGLAKHKRLKMSNQQEVEQFLKTHVLGMINSLSESGYDMSVDDEVGSGLIGPDGTIHKSSSGDHRFYTAKILGLKPFPLIIRGVHEDWYRKAMGNRLNLRLLGEKLSEIEANHL